MTATRIATWLRAAGISRLGVASRSHAVPRHPPGRSPRRRVPAPVEPTPTRRSHNPGKTPSPRRPTRHELDPAKHVVPTTAAAGKLAGQGLQARPRRTGGEPAQLPAGEGLLRGPECRDHPRRQSETGRGVEAGRPTSQKWTDGIPSLHVASPGKGTCPTRSSSTTATHDAGAREGRRREDSRARSTCASRTPRRVTWPARSRPSASGRMSEPPGDEEVPFIQGRSRRR